MGLANNSAQYGAEGTSLVLNANGGAGSTISNLRAGQATTDAANVGQVQQAQQSAVGTSNSFTVQQVAALQTMMTQAFASGLCNFGTGGNVTCGSGSTAIGAGATAMGSNAKANGIDTTAMGNGAEARFAGSVAIGAGAKALADPTTAIGNNAVAVGDNAVALGANTLASGVNSVALGQGSAAPRDNTVSVGNAATGQTRTITNVAPGVLGTDATNVDQLRQSGAQLLGQANTFAARGVAAAMAMPVMPSLTPGKLWVGAAAGQYASEGALGIGFGYQVSEGFNIGAAISSASSGGSKVGARIQTGYAW